MYARIGMIAVVLALLLPAVQAAVSDAPIVSVPQTAPTPSLDGKVEVREWAKAAALSDFVAVGGARMPALRTQVFISYDATNLYLAAICYDPSGQFKADVTQRDGPLFTDDCFELHIDTVGQRKSSETAHLAVNAGGAQYDALGDDASQDFKWTAVAARNADNWSVEIALPFARGIGPKVGDSWLISVGRRVARTGEQSSWAPVGKSFAEMDRLGSLLFSGPPYRVVATDLGNLWLGQNTAHFEVQYLGASPGPGPSASQKLNVRVESGRPADRFFNAVKLRVEDKPLAMEAPYRVSSERSTVVFSLTNGKGQAAWRSAPYPIEAPPVVGALQGLETTLSATLVAWSALPEGARKAALWDSLSELLTAWQLLAQRIAQRETMPPEEYAGLLTQANVLENAAAGLKAQMTP